MRFFFLLLFFTLSLPGVAQEDDEALIESLEQIRKNQLEKTLKLNEMTQKASSVPSEMKKLGYDSINAAALMDDKVIHALRDMLNKTEVKITQVQAREMILKKSQGSFLGQFLQDHPGIVNCLADIIREPKAMSAALGIFLRKDDLKLYGVIWFCYLILGLLFKKIFFNPKWGALKRNFFGLMVSLIVTVISLTTFYKVFQAELSPTVQIIMRHWNQART